MSLKPAYRYQEGSAATCLASAPTPNLNKLCDIPISAAQMDRFFSSLQSLATLVNRIDGAADRLLGAAKLDGCTQEASPLPSDLLGKLDHAIGELQYWVNLLADQAERLERFV